MTEDTSFRACLHRFFERDYEGDVAAINERLSKNSLKDAFKDQPPSILTGDPSSLTPGACLLVLGINPGWPTKEVIWKNDALPALDAWKQGFEAYSAERSRYFTRSGPGTNWRHFSRLGKAIADGFGIANGSSSREIGRNLFQNSAAIFDLVPYWSINMGNINLALVDPDDSPMKDWIEVIRSFIAEKRPRAIVVNSSGYRPLVERMLACELTRLDELDVYSGRSHLASSETPIFVHRQLSAQGGMSHDNYAKAVARWASTLNVPLPLF